MYVHTEKEPFFILNGIVVPGPGIGRFTGLQTADLAPDERSTFPETGVYVSKVLLNGEEWYGATHIGPQPTINNVRTLTVETRILDFCQEIYGRNMRIELYRKLRSTEKFDNVSLLLEQIQSDCAEVRRYWGMSEHEDGYGISSPLYVNTDAHTVCVHGHEIYLSIKEFEVFRLLFEAPDMAFSKEQIYEAVWKEPAYGCCHAVENTVFQIRKKLKPFSGGHDYFRTLSGYGYRYRPE